MNLSDKAAGKTAEGGNRGAAGPLRLACGFGCSYRCWRCLRCAVVAVGGITYRNVLAEYSGTVRLSTEADGADLA